MTDKRYSAGAMRATEQIMAEGSHRVALKSCARTISQETGDLALVEALKSMVFALGDGEIDDHPSEAVRRYVNHARTKGILALEKHAGRAET